MASLLQRGKNYYLQFYRSGRIQVRQNLHTTDEKVAEEIKRRFESAQFSGFELPFPTRTPIEKVLNEYAEHIRSVKTLKSAQTDIYYLRDLFGPICKGIEITCRSPSLKAKRLKRRKGQDRRFKEKRLEPVWFERIRTADITEVIASRVKVRGVAPKTANRYREILSRLFNWSTKNGCRLPGGVNPAAAVERYPENAPQIRFLKLNQIQEQLKAIEGKPQLEAMVATLIYAGLRREELLWLRHEDINWDSEPFGLISVRAKTVDGGASKESWQPKTKAKGVRGVPISSTLRPYLDKQRLRAAKSEWLPEVFQARAASSAQDNASFAIVITLAEASNAGSQK